ncbi:MAG: nucleotidyltransferase domain-containing protein [Aureliella sp.]
MLIYSVGTQVVTRKDVFAHADRIAHPAGAVGVVVRAPVDPAHSYRVKFLDGFEASLHHAQLVRLSDYKNEQIHRSDATMNSGLYERVIFRCVIGSRAYGLEDEGSDTDRRGVYLPPAHMHWSLLGVPEQIENEETQECYWELQKFLVLALKANPNVLECLYSPIVETLTPLGEELIGMRGAFLSKLVFQTYSGYVASQFKKMQGDLRNHGRIKWKHVMHLIRLLMSGIHVLRSGEISVDVGPNRDRLLAIKRGEVPFRDTEAWRSELQSEFEAALAKSSLPDRPDYERANDLLIRARSMATSDALP